MMPDYVTVNVKPDTWHELNIRKKPGDSFDDVIRKALGLDHDGIEDDLEALDLNDEEKEAVRAMYEFVRDRGETTPKEITAELQQRYPAGKQNEEWWWKSFCDPLVELPGIERPSQRRVVFIEER